MNFRTSLQVIILFFFFSHLNAQKTSDEYWEKVLIAGNFYDHAQYPEAAEAYAVAFTKDYEAEIANHRLYAAASNCMIDNEQAVKKHLSKIVSIATKKDIRRVLVNYKIFDKYKEKEWWLEMHKRFDERLASLIAHHKNLKIFKHGRNLKYSAIRILSLIHI